MKNLLKKIHEELKINSTHLAQYKLTLCEEPSLDNLEVVAIDFKGRPFILEKTAAEAWRRMCEAARQEQIELVPFSGFRSYIYQKQLIARKLALGRPLEAILTETAIPGYSEHHSGHAVDICSDGKFELSENFEQTAAFSWLVKNAARFHFSLSYPRDNNSGIIYEPWHWRFTCQSIVT